MATTIPSSNLQVYKNLNISQQHKLLMLESQLNSFMNSSAFKTYTAMSFLGVTDNYIDVAELYENIYDISYMRYNNVQFGNKWFYAYVDRIEYINNNTTRIYYNPDHMTTWLYDFTVPLQSIERQHTLDDTIYAHCEPESFTASATVRHNRAAYNFSPVPGPGVSYIFLYVPNKEVLKSSNYNATTNKIDFITEATSFINNNLICGNLFMGCAYYVLNLTLADNAVFYAEYVAAIINKLVEINAVILSVYPFPTTLLAPDWYANGKKILNISPLGERDYFFYNNSPATYTPVNNKLYIYPYRMLKVTDYNGNTIDYKWENLNLSQIMQKPTFNISAIPVPAPQIILYPAKYGNWNDTYLNSLISSGSPTCSWSEDSFARWNATQGQLFAQQFQTQAIETFLANIVAGLTLFTGNIPAMTGGMISSIRGVNSLKNQYNQWVNMSNQTDSAKGNTSGLNMMYAMGNYGFYFEDMGISGQEAAVIDSYFTMYGYSDGSINYCNVFQALDNNDLSILRPAFNYLKLTDAIIKPKSGRSVPQDAKNDIQKQLTEGVTFWMTSNIGNYAQNNSPAAAREGGRQANEAS